MLKLIYFLPFHFYMRAQYNVLEIILIVMIVLALVVTAHIWAEPILGGMMRHADIESVGNQMRSLDKMINEVSHQPGAVRTIEMDLGEGDLWFDSDANLVVYSILAGDGETARKVVPTSGGSGTGMLCMLDYSFDVAGGIVEINGQEVVEGGVALVEGGHVQVEDIGGSSVTFACLPDRVPLQKRTDVEGEIETELILAYGFDIEGSGQRTGKVKLTVSNVDGVVKLEF